MKLRAAVIAVLVLAATTASAETITVLTHDAFAISQEVVQAFTDSSGIEVHFLQGGDAGEVVNRAILTRDRPLADVLYGVDNTLLTRARDAGIFEPYVSPALDAVPQELRFSPGNLVTPIDVGYVVFNADKEALENANLPPPADLEELTAPAYRGLTVVEDPATSSPGLALLYATVARFGEGGEGDWLDFWARLRDNDVQVADGWSEAYYTAFTRYGGDRPIVLSYATSPAAEVIFADHPLDTSPTANVLCSRCAFRQIEGVGILKGTAHRAAAEAFVDFMLSPAFQRDVPGQMFVYPVREGTPLPPEFERWAAIPTSAQTATLDPDVIAANQKRWLEQWTQVVQQGRSPAAVR
jgi:thiamine transport system substrate-binding protein